MKNYMAPCDFRKKYPTIKGKLYGGDVIVSSRMIELDKVLRAMNRCNRPWTVEDASCGNYHQKVVKVAPK